MILIQALRPNEHRARFRELSGREPSTRTRCYLRQAAMDGRDILHILHLCVWPELPISPRIGGCVVENVVQ